jgi:hypothetical protein
MRPFNKKAPDQPGRFQHDYALLIFPRLARFSHLAKGRALFVGQLMLTRNPDFAELEGATHLQIAQSLQQIVVDLRLQFLGVAAKYAHVLRIEDDAMRHIVQNGNDIPKRIVDPGKRHVSVALFIVGKLGDSHLCSSFAWVVRAASVISPRMQSAPYHNNGNGELKAKQFNLGHYHGG